MDASRCGLLVAGHLQDGGYRILQGTECESAVQICAGASERRIAHGEDTQMDVEQVHGLLGISTGSDLLDDHDRLDARHEQEGLKGMAGQAPQAKSYYGHQRAQA